MVLRRKSTLCKCFFLFFFLVSHYLLVFSRLPASFSSQHTHAHPISSALLLLSLCFRWCRCCGRLIEMREEMTAPCISASLQSPALPSTSASGTAAVGTQSFPSPSLSLSLCISLNSLPLPSTHTMFISHLFFSQDSPLPLKIPLPPFSPHFCHSNLPSIFPLFRQR